MITTHDRFKSTIGFIDILFNILNGFAFLFIVAFLLIKPESKKEDFDRKAEFIIVMEWDDSRKDDIDLYVQDPTGKIVNFRDPRVNFMHLDKDDLGIRNDTIWVDGKEQVVEINREVVTIRGIITGEHIINAHYYSTHTYNKTIPPPLYVNVKLHKVNPYSVIWEGRKLFSNRGQEFTYLRFTVENDGRVMNEKIRVTRKRMIGKYGGPGGGW